MADEAMIREVFNDFDEDGNGSIDGGELKAAMARLGRNLSDEEIADMIKFADVDGDGEIQFDEFMRMMK